MQISSYAGLLLSGGRDEQRLPGRAKSLVLLLGRLLMASLFLFVGVTQAGGGRPGEGWAQLCWWLPVSSSGGSCGAGVPLCLCTCLAATAQPHLCSPPALSRSCNESSPGTSSCVRKAAETVLPNFGPPHGCPPTSCFAASACLSCTGLLALRWGMLLASLCREAHPALEAVGAGWARQQLAGAPAAVAGVQHSTSCAWAACQLCLPACRHAALHAA